MKLKILPRFKALLPELTAEERSLLRESIRIEGCREPLTVWDHPSMGLVLIDGHNRYMICKELKRPFKIRKVQFADEEAAADWIDTNQLARRNLTPDAFRLALGRRYNRVKKTHGGQVPGSRRAQNEPSLRTAAKLASEHGVSAATVKRAAKFAKEVEGDPDLQRAIRERKPVSKAKKEKNLEVRRARVIAETRAVAKERPMIMLADCMKMLADVPPIDLLLTDPPYFTDGDFTKSVSAYLDRVKSTGQAYVFSSADPKEIAGYLAMNRRGMTLTQVLVWNYNNTGQRQPKDRYNSNYQVVLYFRGPKAALINRPSDGTHQYACQTVNAPDGRIGDRFHEWQKPIDLIERYVLNSSKPGDLVCDPFAGTGTTLLAAAKHGRRSLGYEIDEKVIRIAVERGCVNEL